MPIGNQIQYTDNVASKIVSATATASQTTFTIVGGYRVNAIAVYKQGLRLSNGVDFTATDGSTVVLTSGASADDKMVFQIYDDFSVADISAAPGDFTVGGDLGVSGTLSGDGSGLTGVASTDNVSTSSLNVVGVATIAIDASVGRNFEVLAGVSTFAGIVNASKDVRVTRNLNVTGVSTLTGYVGLSTGLTVAGVSTLTGKVIAEGALDLKGQTNHLAGSEHILMPSGGLLFQHNPGSGSENVLLMHTDYCKLYQGNTLRLETTTSGITVSGVSAFTEDVRVTRNLNVSGVSTTTLDVRAGRNFDAVGISTLTGVVNAGADVRVTRNLNVTGVSTFTGDVATSAILIPAQDVRVGRNFNVTGIATVTQGTDLNGYKVEEGSHDTDALNGEFDFEFENGHVQTHTGSTAGTYFPDFRVSSGQSLDSVMGVGDVVSATLMVAASNTAHYCTTGIKIDNSTSNLTIEWVGSAAPTAGKGAGYDIYAFTIQKTAATPAYLIIVNALDAG